MSKAYTSEAEYQLARAAAHDGVVGHKATPYQVSGCMAGTKSIIVHGDENTFDPIIAEVCDAATAAFIVRACNEYDTLKRKADAVDGLVKALKLFFKAGACQSTDFSIQLEAFKAGHAAIDALAAAGAKS